MSSTLLEVATLILVFCLALILTIYNRRQARALEHMARLEEDRSSREIQDRRELKAAQIQIEPLKWLEAMVNPLLDAPLTLAGSPMRVVQEIDTVEFKADDGRKLLVSTRGLAELRHYDRANRKLLSSIGAAERLKRFAASPLFQNHWRIWNASRTLADSGECFDLEAQVCGRGLGLDWGAPTRLWFYLLPA